MNRLLPSCLPLIFRRTFIKPTVPLSKAWKQEEDQSLVDAFKKHGPAWTVVSFAVRSRSPVECRKRHLSLSGTVSKLKEMHPRDRDLIFQEGYEMGKDGYLIKFPEPVIEVSPYKKLAEQLPQKIKKKGANGRPWTELERMVVREAYEALGPNWLVISKVLVKRTPKEIHSMMIDSTLELQQ
jgi:hypothetical protein